MPRKLPALDVKTNMNHSPHVVVLGAGASLATIPDGDRNGRKAPLMNNLVEVIGLKSIMARHDVEYKNENFEHIFDRLKTSEKHPDLIDEIEKTVFSYFSNFKLPEKATLYDYLILSLRKKDMIATFNWDPLLAQAFVRNMNIVVRRQFNFIQ